MCIRDSISGSLKDLRQTPDPLADDLGRRVRVVEPEGVDVCLAGVKGISGDESDLLFHRLAEEVERGLSLGEDMCIRDRHNGIIENAREIRADLEAHGIKFHTETDTESAGQYLGYVYDGDPKAAIVKLTKRIRGAFALVIMFYDKPNEIWVARKGSPLVVGRAENEGFCASDPTALLEYTRDVWFMDDDETVSYTHLDVYKRQAPDLPAS